LAIMTSYQGRKVDDSALYRDFWSVPTNGSAPNEKGRNLSVPATLPTNREASRFASFPDADYLLGAVSSPRPHLAWTRASSFEAR
jgi:hypothetical protein